MLHLFTAEQGTFLLRLLLAHTVSDFVLQTKKMVESKRLFSPYMLLHIFLVFIPALLASGVWEIALIIAVSHWLIDTLKVTLIKKYASYGYMLFIIDQCIHFLIILILWGYHYGVFNEIYQITLWPFNDFNICLVLLGYAIVTWPLGYILKYTLHKVSHHEHPAHNEEGGKLIGRFERIIVLTFVLVNHYEAIGLLIVAKGIMHLADKDKNTDKSLMVGTMMSYAVSIIIGVLINWVLGLHKI